MTTAKGTITAKDIMIAGPSGSPRTRPSTAPPS